MRKTILTLSLGAFLVPALAFAANPAKNSSFRWAKVPNSITFRTSKDGKYIKQVDAYSKCSPVPATYPRIRVRDGRFSKSGTTENVLHQKIEYSFKGHFVTKRKAKGTFDLDKRGCDKPPIDFVARKYDPNAG